MINRSAERPALRRVDLQSKYIYGPVDSRRLGKSLGINPMPFESKVCSFDCIYCQYGFETPVAAGEPPADDIFPHVGAILADLERYVRDFDGRIDAITFSGNGEATLHPDFHELVIGTVRVRDRYLPRSRIALLSNGTTVVEERVRRAIRWIDDPIMKLDAGSEELWSRINRPGMGVRLEEIIAAMANIDNIIIQSLFFEGGIGDGIGNISGAIVEEWLFAIERIHPRYVQIYTLDRVPAMVDLKPVSIETLEWIRSSLENRGIRGQVY
jgi:wyosine [tRNA(Phe)-imidazoG37] synthetase (radical SAM superfamily)